MPIATTPADFVAWFRSVAPYINAFRGKTFVIAFGGEVVADGKFVELTMTSTCWPRSASGWCWCARARKSNNIWRKTISATPTTRASA